MSAKGQTDYGQIIIDLTGVAASSDVSLSIKIDGSTFTFGQLQDLSFEGINGVTGVSVSPNTVKLAVSAGTTLGGLLTIYGTVDGGGPVTLTANAADFSTSSSKSFDVTWTSSGSGEGNLISGSLTLGGFIAA